MSFWREPTAKNAFVLSLISVLFTLIAAFIGIGYYMTTGSTLTLVFGLENVVDFLSSVVVLWRFFLPGKMTKEKDELLRRREVRASTVISFILVLLGIGVIASAANDIAKGADEEHEMRIVVAIAFTSVFIFGSLAIVKFHYARLLQSDSLFKDGVCSMIGTVLAAALFVNTLIIQAKPNVWWLDPLVALLCGVAALLIGLYSICILWRVKRVPICSCSWWLMSRGDGSGAPSLPDIKTDEGDEGDCGDETEGKPPSDLEMKEMNDAETGNGAVINLSAEVV